MIIVGSAVLIFLVGVAIGLKVAELTYIKAMEEADEEIDEMIDKFVRRSMSEKEQEKKTHWDRFTELFQKVMEKDKTDSKTVVALKYYEPFYIYIMAGELAVMNDNLKRIAEALEMRNDREERS